ncbi:hypothetical protein [Alistipes sp. ZOR0009]|jgi:hypothetical protein|uniref:hypothetical protein n=1 Tax=Alistipes sp. ZOR0009 TaxID=1339253 RepID=UPI000AF565E7|nr:hypothetical protein [Alistipes sp. ZOR0009]
MNTPNPSMLLKQRIAELETQQKQEGKELKEQLIATYQSMRLVNVIKNSLREVVESQEIREDLLSLTIIQTQNWIGRLLQKMLNANEDTPIKTVIITLVQAGISNLIANGFERFKCYIESLFNAKDAAPNTPTPNSENAE